MAGFTMTSDLRPPPGARRGTKEATCRFGPRTGRTWNREDSPWEDGADLTAGLDEPSIGKPLVFTPVNNVHWRELLTPLRVACGWWTATRKIVSAAMGTERLTCGTRRLEIAPESRNSSSSLSGTSGGSPGGTRNIPAVLLRVPVGPRQGARSVQQRDLRSKSGGGFRPGISCWVRVLSGCPTETNLGTGSRGSLYGEGCGPQRLRPSLFG